MAAATQHALLMLIGICREGQRELCETAWTLRRVDLRVLVLEAFDQRTEMLRDLCEFAPECDPQEIVRPGWVLRNGKTANESTLVAGEESTLRAAEQLTEQVRDPRLRFTLQIHVLRLRSLVSRFRSASSNLHKS